ncbi:Inositol 2-dehydrogenase [Rubripirellula obstinata]|uniref:Inositol 2-dehydrogenase n=1 Tax=Rubripirellula obstinata TaxID=406547 RepID=A0A5B1CG47_9BACT|nr:Gfo/Idh/MocA family oxidoreductase [Rubripirellula obstinata]KAA1260168.1 Inositol 2-dehydrogenase [Rubripirellula obstinata]
MNQNTRSSRRRFIQSTAAFGGAAVLANHWQPSHAAAPTVPPSERVNLAVVGIGNRGRQDLEQMTRTRLCNVVALCDVDLKGQHTQSSQKAHPKAKRFTDFRKMFDKMADKIDAVMIATTDHSHFAIAMLAMSLGKHVYVEKPLAHTFGQCARLIDLADRSGVVTQMGNQGHSGGNYFQFKAWTEAGLIKDVTRITAYMNNPRRWHGWGQSVTEYPTDPMPAGLDWDTWIATAPVHPFSKKLHPAEWRSWFDYGCGAFGDWGPHILDTSHRFLNLGLPEKVTAVKRDGANELVFPQASTIRFDFPERGDMPACKITWYDGVNNKPEIEDGYIESVTDPKTGKTTTGQAEATRPGKVIYGKDLAFKGASHGSTLSVLSTKGEPELDLALPEFSQDNSNHYENFLLACKGQEESRSPFSVSGALTQVFNIGVIAQRLGGEIKFDRETNRITNNDRAQSLLDPSPRKGWEEFYSL